MIERRDPGSTAFVEIARVGDTLLRHDDRGVVALATYAYRVAAVGLAGAGPYSNVATATAPAPMDNTPPTATITAPADGDTVSGRVSVSATFTDDVGVAYARLSFSPALGDGVICTRTSNPPAPTLTLSCSWDTRKLANRPPAASLTAYAQDAIGNWVQRSIDVNVSYGSKGRRK